MKTLLALLALALLGGCGYQLEDPHMGYGDSYDYAFADGLRFRNNPPVTAFTQTQTQHMIDDVYHEVEVCAGISAPGPLIVAVPNGSIDVGGFQFNDLIVVTDNSAQDGWDIMPYTTGPLSVLRHEIVHYLLWTNGFSDDDNYYHRSPLFVQCSGSPGVTG